jgi:hypothetical protein
VRELEDLVPDFSSGDEEILRRLIIDIAFSNNAKAVYVAPLVDGGVFKAIFQDYTIDRSAALDPDRAVAEHWHEIKAIRFKYKIRSMVECAKRLRTIRENHGSFMAYLKTVGLPNAIASESDILAFWDGFTRVRAYLLALDFPYFKNFTSLCHLLKDLGFDCAKPDLVVMRAAVGLGIVPPLTSGKVGTTHAEHDLRKAVETIQRYAVARNLRASVVDFYFLIYGRQTDAVRFVKSEYYAFE